MSEGELVKHEEFMVQINDAELNRLRSQIVMSNDNLNLKSQFATSKKWDSLRSQNVTIEGRRGQHRIYLPYAFTPKQWIKKSQQAVDQISSQAHLRSEKPIAKQAAAQFGTKIAKQAVAQLVQIPWGQNITKNLPDEFRSSLPSIEEIEAELSEVEESQ